MKFGHEFQDFLDREGYSEAWRKAAVPYSQLKKCLKSIQRELRELGLDPDTLHQLLVAQTASLEPLAKYNIEGTDSLRPKLTVLVDIEDGVLVDASLSPASRAALRNLISRRGSTAGLIHNQDVAQQPAGTSDSVAADGGCAVGDSTALTRRGDKTHERIEVPLSFDGEFFALLRRDFDNMDQLEKDQQGRMTTDIEALGSQISKLAKPSNLFSKSDLSRWREIFELYVDAQVFFSTHERDHGARNSERALDRLVWFQGEVQQRELLAKFKLPTSTQAYSKFLDLNASLIRYLKFQEYNRVAVQKILKKFDKRTALGVSRTFPTTLRTRGLMTESLAKGICAEVSQQLVSTVPRLEDYTCPVCLSLAWLPVRLKCSHVFCVRCVIKLQRERRRLCPLCRDSVVMEANLDNLDNELTKYLQKYFRKETKEKQKANETERGIELFGENYKHSECSVM